MLSISHNNVNDRISNRADNGVSGSDIGLLRFLETMRCYLHQVCFVCEQGWKHHFSKLELAPATPTPPETWLAGPIATRTTRRGSSVKRS